MQDEGGVTKKSSQQNDRRCKQTTESLVDACVRVVVRIIFSRSAFAVVKISAAAGVYPVLSCSKQTNAQLKLMIENASWNVRGRHNTTQTIYNVLNACKLGITIHHVLVQHLLINLTHLHVRSRDHTHITYCNVWSKL